MRNSLIPVFHQGVHPISASGCSVIHPLERAGSTSVPSHDLRLSEHASLHGGLQVLAGCAGLHG